MSIMDVLKKDLGGKKKPGEGSPVESGAAPAEAASATTGARTTRGVPAVLSGLPRVDLLPPEIGQRQRDKAARRWMRVSVFVVLVLSLAGIGGAWALNMIAQSSLVAAQGESQQLAAKQTEYKDVQDVQQTIAVGEAARRVGASVEIDWKSVVDQVQGSLPAGVSLDSVEANSISVTEPYRVGDSPLDGTSVAEVTLTLKSQSLPSVPELLNSLSGLTGFVDAVPTSLTLDESGYTTTVTLHLDEKAFTGRYDDAKKADG